VIGIATTIATATITHPPPTNFLLRENGGAFVRRRFRFRAPKLSEIVSAHSRVAQHGCAKLGTLPNPTD
jgi:hypothetical protein